MTEHQQVQGNDSAPSGPWEISLCRTLNSPYMCGCGDGDHAVDCDEIAVEVVPREVAERLAGALKAGIRGRPGWISDAEALLVELFPKTEEA